MTDPLRRACLTMVLFLGCGVQAAEFAPPPRQVRQWDLWEIRLAGPALPEGILPNHPGQVVATLSVTAPDGKTTDVPMFHSQPHRRLRADPPRPNPAAAKTKDKDKDDDDRSIKRPTPDFVPAGPSGWTGRFAPRQSGRHRYTATLRLGEGAATVIGKGFFTATPPAPDARGFVRRHPTLPSRFQTDDGRGWFAIGHNVCWVAADEGVEQYELYFDAMKRAGENCLRLWLCTWDLDLDGRRPYAPDELVAARLDAVFDAAARRGLYVMLCLDNFHDFRENWDKSPFNAANGGSCPDRLSFWTAPAAREQYRAKLRYLVARHAARWNLLAWELWNEMDYALKPADVPEGTGPANPSESVSGWLKREAQIPWTREMAGELKRLDPQRHLVSTSLGMHVNWRELWQAPEMDFAQFHSYIHYLEAFRTDLERDEARLALACQQAVADYGKPAWVSEFGYMGEGSASSMNPRDPEGILLHNAIWSGALSGSAGIPMFWWWDNYLHRRDLYRHYATLSRFLAPVDWNEAFEPFRDETAELRMVGLLGTANALFWLQNRENTWDLRITKQRTPRRLTAEVLFPAPGAGTWRVEWYDPHAGVVVGEEKVEAREEDGRFRLSLKPPGFTLDLAARLVLSQE